MSTPHRDRVAPGDGPKPEPVDLPLAIAMLLLHHDLIEHVQRMTWMLTAGDFEALVIWCALLHHNGKADGGASSPLPLCDLVAATTIPRETVRRKLERLAALGYVTRVDRGWVVRTGPLDPALRERALASARSSREAIGLLLPSTPAVLPGSTSPPLA